MSENTDRETRPAGREVSVLVFGSTADELELAALDEARPFFGDGVRLTVVRDWSASGAGAYRDIERYREAAAGKAYFAHILVCTIEAGD